MSEQAARRGAMEEAAAAHAAKVRRRVLLGGLAGAVLALTGAGAYLAFGGDPLDRAAERAEERTARLRFSVDGGAPGETTSFSGEYVTTGDNERFAGEGTVTLDDEGAQPATVRKIGDRIWVRTERADAQRGRPWIRLAEDDAPWAPAQMLGLLGSLERVRQERRESAAGRRTTRYSARLPLEELLGRDAEGSVPIEAWLDDDGLPVLIRSEVTDFRLELEVLEWGVPVEVEAPPAQQVTDP